jgi:hypothetical protein
MVMFVRSPRGALISGIITLIILAIVYFAVIKPAQNTTNQVLSNANQQEQQALSTSSLQLKQAQQQVGGNPSAQKALTHAQQVEACVAAAGTDPTKLAACH